MFFLVPFRFKHKPKIIRSAHVFCEIPYAPSTPPRHTYLFGETEQVSQMRDSRFVFIRTPLGCCAKYPT